MLYTTYLLWFGGWSIIIVPTLLQLQSTSINYHMWMYLICHAFQMFVAYALMLLWLLHDPQVGQSPSIPMVQPFYDWNQNFHGTSGAIALSYFNSSFWKNPQEVKPGEFILRGMWVNEDIRSVDDVPFKCGVKKRVDSAGKKDVTKLSNAYVTTFKL